MSSSRKPVKLLANLPGIWNEQVEALWCDQEYMSEVLKRDYVYSRKPNSSLLSTNHVYEELIRQDIANNLQIDGDCELEIIMIDL